MSKAAVTAVAPVHPILLDREAAAACIGVSVPTFERLVAQGRVPKPLQVSNQLVRWRYTDLVAYCDGLGESTMLPPKNCQMGRAGRAKAGANAGVKAGATGGRMEGAA